MNINTAESIVKALSEACDFDIFDDYSYGEINTAIDMVEQDQRNAGITDTTQFDEIYDNYPVLMDYDNNGGYVGSLANENGLTP